MKMIILGLSVDIKEKLPSLQNCCLVYVLFHLEEFPTAHLALLPAAMRTQLLLHLPIADLFRLEGTAVANGVEIGKIWSTILSTVGAKNFILKEEQYYFDTVLSLLIDANSRQMSGPPAGLKLFGIRNWNPEDTEYIIPPRYCCSCYAYGSASELSNFFSHFLTDKIQCLELSSDCLMSEPLPIIWIIQFAQKLEKLELERSDEDGIEELSPELCSSLCNFVAKPCFQSLKVHQQQDQWCQEGSGEEAEVVEDAPLPGDFICNGFMITLNRLKELLITFFTSPCDHLQLISLRSLVIEAGECPLSEGGNSAIFDSFVCQVKVSCYDHALQPAIMQYKTVIFQDVCFEYRRSLLTPGVMRKEDNTPGAACEEYCRVSPLSHNIIYDEYM